MKKIIFFYVLLLSIGFQIHTVESSLIEKKDNPINFLIPFSKEINDLLNSEEYKKNLEYIRKNNTPYPNILNIESENANELNVQFSKAINIKKTAMTIVNENGTVYEKIHISKVRPINNNIYAIPVHKHLKANESYVLEVNYVNETIKVTKPFQVNHSLKYYQINYEILDEKNIKIYLNKNIRNVGYFYANNFKGFISRQKNNEVYIQLDKPLEENQTYDFNIKYSSNPYGLNIENIYGYFIYEPNHSPVKTKEIISLNAYQHKVIFSKGILTSSGFYNNNKDIYFRDKEGKDIYYPQQVQYLSEKEVLLSFSQKIPNGDYFLTANKVKDFFGIETSVSSFPFSISLLQKNNNYPVVKEVVVLSNNTLRLLYDKPLNEYSVEKLANYQLINMDDFTASYKVKKVSYNYKKQSIDISTNIDIGEKNFLILSSGIKDTRQRTMPSISHQFKSVELDKVKIMDVKYKFNQNQDMKHSLILILNKSINKRDANDVRLLHNNKLVSPSFKGNELVFDITPSMFGEKVIINVGNSDIFYDFSYTYNIPDYKEKLSVSADLFKNGKEKFVTFSFREPVEFETLKYISLSNRNNNISYGIIDNRKNNEKYVNKVTLKVEDKISELPIDILIPFENVISLYHKEKKDKSDIHLTILNYTFLNKPFVKKLQLVQSNLIRVELAESTVVNEYFYSELKNQIGVTNLQKQQIIETQKIKVDGSVIDIYTSSPLDDNQYAVTFLKGLLIQEQNPSIKSNSMIFKINGYDFKNNMTPYLAKEWLQDKHKSEILFSYEGSLQYSVYGEQNTVEPKSHINLYTSNYELIGTSYGTTLGSFAKILIPNEYLKEQYFILESIDEKGNIARLNIVM